MWFNCSTSNKHIGHKMDGASTPRNSKLSLVGNISNKTSHIIIFTILGTKWVCLVSVHEVWIIASSIHLLVSLTVKHPFSPMSHNHLFFWSEKDTSSRLLTKFMNYLRFSPPRMWWRHFQIHLPSNFLLAIQQYVLVSILNRLENLVIFFTCQPKYPSKTLYPCHLQISFQK